MCMLVHKDKGIQLHSTLHEGFPMLNSVDVSWIVYRDVHLCMMI